MSLYKLIFNEYVDEEKSIVTNKKGFYFHNVNNLIIKEDDIEEFKDYGNGIKDKIYIGKLHRS